MLQVIAGYDPNDTGSTDTPVQDYTGRLAANTSSLRLGIPHAHFYEGLHPEIQAAIELAVSVLGKLTSSQHEVEIPPLTDVAILVQRAEAYSYHREYITKSPELYQPETLKRIRSGAEISAADYISVRRQLDQLRRPGPKLFDTVDLIITPTVPVPPPTISELLADLEHLRARELVMLPNTRPFNLLGLPTISVRCGFTREGLPIGIQVSGPAGGEATVLRLAHAYERATEWHKRKPNLG